MVRREVRFQIRSADNGLFHLDTWVIQSTDGEMPTKSLEKTDGPFWTKGEARTFARSYCGATPDQIL